MYINFCEELNKTTTDILVSLTDTPTTKKLLSMLYKKGYNFIHGENYNIELPCDELKKQIETDFYRWYHGNSKPILHIFYNSITGKNELQLATRTVIRTYPQYKNAKIQNYFG